MQSAHRATANAGALAGPKHYLHGHVFGPAVAELPGFLDPLGNGGRPFARRAKDRLELIVDGIGKHWAVRLVGARQLGHLRTQSGQVGLGGPVDGT